MKIEGIKTRIVRAGEVSLESLLSESIHDLADGSIIAISSKVVALCENRVESLSSDIASLVKRESEYYLPRDFSPYHHTFSITQGTLIARAGIDESNADGHLVMWPKDAMASAERIRRFFADKYNLQEIGVIITDSTCTPLRRGTIGVMIGWSGFLALNDLRGKKDLFDRTFQIETSGVAGSLAAAANIVMGEGDEQKPIAVISDAEFVKFMPRPPTESEIAVTFVDKDEDLFAPFFNLAQWESGDHECSN